MSFKCRILGPVYSKGRHYVLHEGAIDPHDAKEALFEALYAHRPGRLRDLASAAYYFAARAKYRYRTHSFPTADRSVWVDRRGPPGDADGWEAAEAEAQPIPVPDPIDLLVLTRP